MVPQALQAAKNGQQASCNSLMSHSTSATISILIWESRRFIWNLTLRTPANERIPVKQAEE
jgi:hypothetical protein